MIFPAAVTFELFTILQGKGEIKAIYKLFLHYSLFWQICEEVESLISIGIKFHTIVPLFKTIFQFKFAQ
jgi:hypothetical protein